MDPVKTFPNATSAPTLKDVADLIKDGKVKNLICLNGAGISTAAGIPDFRSPETGLYANLSKYNLPTPEAIFDIHYFYERPEAFFTLAKDLWPGNYSPTLTHYFFVLLHKKGLLKRVFTQNVDTLERMAGLPDEMIVEAHGSFASAHCMACKKEYNPEELRPRIAKGEVLRCPEKKCQGKYKGLIKSDIVFFGEALPPLFFRRMSDFSSCDLLITLGTSLKVHPFAGLIDRVSSTCPRVLINLESVGEIDEYYSSGSNGMFGSYREEGFDFNGSTRGGKKENARDVLFLGEADKGIRELAGYLGWEKELEELYKEGHAALKSKNLKTTDSTNNASFPVSAAEGSSKQATPDTAIKSNTAAAAAEAEKVSSEIGEQVEKPVDPKRVEEGKKEEEKEFSVLAKELEKLDVTKEEGDESAFASTRDSKVLDKEDGKDDDDKKASL